MQCMNENVRESEIRSFQDSYFDEAEGLSSSDSFDNVSVTGT